MPNQITDWGNALLVSAAGALAIFLAAVPRIIGFLLILLIGWLIASAIAAALSALLRTIKFDEFADRAGFGSFIASTGVKSRPTDVIAGIAKWFVRLITLVVAFDSLGLSAVSDVLRQLLLWLPNLVVGLVMLILGGWAANALSGLVRGAATRANLGNPDVLATVTKIAIWAFAIVVAANQVGVAATLVNTLFMAVVGAAALALGLAFGLGGRETAARIVAQWYAQGQRDAAKIEHAVDSATSQTTPKTIPPPMSTQRQSEPI